MKRLLVVSLLYLLSLIPDFAQAQSDRSLANGGRGRDQFYRRDHDCRDPFPMRSFNRDFSGLAGSNFYFLQKTLQEYTRLRCLTSEQVRRLAVLFPTDREKYDYLTFAFNHVFDIENFAMTGTVLANRNAKDAFYRFLVREGVPAGDYFCDPWVFNDPYFAPPQYRDRFGNIIINPRVDNRYLADRNNNPYDNFSPNNPYFDNRLNNNGINSGFGGMLSYQEFEILREQIRRNTLDKGRLDDARRLTRENRLTVNQIVEITRLFNSDANRLEYAKFAYDYAYDRENYRQVVDAMAFESNRRDLLRFLEGKR